MLHSSQLKSAVCYILFFTVALSLFILYTSRNSRELVFKSQYTALNSRAQLISSTLSGVENLSIDSVNQVMDQIADGDSAAHTLVVDASGNCLYDSDSACLGAAILELYPDILRSLNNKDYFNCLYSGGVTSSRCCVPIITYGSIVGAVYICETETEQSAMISVLEHNLYTITAILEFSVIIIALILARVFSARANRIFDSIDHIKNQDYTYKINLSGNDEYSSVANEFDKLTEKLSESEEVRRRFVSDASHELKTPLASIKLLSETIIQNQMDRPTELEFVNDICSEADRLNRMSQKLLSLSKVDSTQDEEKEIVDAENVINKVLRMLLPLAREKDINLIFDSPEPVTVLATEDALYQIIFNLVENAIKYNRSQGKVIVHTEKLGENIVISVSDTGIGIPNESMPYIFDRFYRVDKARSRAIGGAGLGLSIVHDLVLSNFGTISVEPNSPEGTRFVLQFPYFGENIENTNHQ